ncbi:3-oxoacyl-[acyl-carrier-protein] reductase FabG-like [Zingiber officinale]|uniref:Ketoreductase domain-containing protein n=1 Tax=Zingiber officinale TaxID=94328 RepID=A0A8J5G1S0_ZINOF|nr:3-oxoacyl-[acyl-carrier-protein] reductase FabG-like [Zingiber officinale]KAG6498870.1 hypothetical protein ZIOFF_038620 [Zingiber officinale]
MASAAAAAMGDRSLEGKVVMVTGASSGIGREICLDLADGGCKIVAAARRLQRLLSLCDEINGSSAGTGSVRAVAVELDVGSGSAAIEAAVKAAWEAFGHVDVLVNNAGVRGGVYSSLDWSESDWNNNVNTNLTGLWLVTKHLCHRMTVAGRYRGSVINISSIAGLQRGQLPGSLAYSVSKTAVNSLTRVMALELGVYGIRVNSICPGLFKSEITNRLMEKAWLGKVAEKTVPLRTFGTVNPAVTSAIRYLISDASEYVTGNIFVVDAGATLPGVPIFSCL